MPEFGVVQKEGQNKHATSIEKKENVVEEERRIDERRVIEMMKKENVWNVTYSKENEEYTKTEWRRDG